MLVEIASSVGRALWPQTVVEVLIYISMVSIVVIYVKSVKRNKEFMALPGPTPWPIVGNAPFLGKQPHKTLLQLSQKYGPIYRLKMGSVEAVILCDLDIIRCALIKQREVFSGRPKFESYKAVSAGESVVFNDSESLAPWKSHKSKILRHLHKFATSVRSKEKVNSIITTECMLMLQCLHRRSQDGFVDPEDVIRMTIANVMCAVCYGNRFEYENEDFRKLLSMNKEFGKVIELGPIIDAMPWITVIPKFKKAIDDYMKINSLLDSWGLERVREILKKFDKDDVTNVVSSMTSEVLESKEDDSKRLTESDSKRLTKSEMQTISSLAEDVLGAGQHTTSGTFFWVINILLFYPKVLQRITNEVRSKIGERIPTLEDQADLPYVEAFLTEVLRFASPLSSTIPHSTVKDTTLKGYKIKRNTMVIISQYSVNHDPKIWRNPEVFDPERFLTRDENTNLVFNDALAEKVLSFSVGERKCPGSRLSQMVLFLATCLLVHTGTLYPNPDRPPSPVDDAQYGLILRPEYISMKFLLDKKWTNFGETCFKSKG